MPPILELGTLSLQRGQKAAGSLPVAPRGDGTSVILPLLAAVGSEEGPTLVVSGGVHGDEYEGPRAIQLLWQQLDTSQMHGTWIGVPAVNLPAFEVGRRESPVDGVNMNRIFPGRPEGFLSDRIAHAFMEQVVARADFYLDIHAGGNGFSMVPTIIFLESGNEAFRARERALARAAGVEVLWKGTGGWSSAHVEAVRRGIPAILAEIGEEGRCKRERLDLAMRVIHNVMIHAGILPGEQALPERWNVVSGTYMQSGAGGCFYASAQAGDWVREGENLGTIINLWGEPMESVTAPHDGLVVSTRTFPSIRPGEWTTFVGKILETWE
ncbi:MAG TPA: succinylglutamate desuccinylase/aspartoacylase family protein [Anaerolineae bacterium]|nr:succinylglutamate desuccinylase/aspartoacylase family protein [Anaerolineae bacterium]